MSTEPIQVYVQLLNEGTEVYRPTTGVFVGPDVIRLNPNDAYDPDLEEWEFPPGSEVRCVAEQRSGRMMLVARERALAAAGS